MTTQQILQGVHDWTNGKIVYDISVAHPDEQGKPTPYADLTAALGNGGANIPEPLRKGGMSVKFIKGSAQSSDNNYVKFFCTDQNFTTDVTQWQGVDDGIHPGSQLLAKSGDVYDGFNENCNRIGNFDGQYKLSFLVSSNEHSSSNDRIAVKIKKGESFTLKLTEGSGICNKESVSYYCFDENNIEVQHGTLTFDTDKNIVASGDIYSIGVYFYKITKYGTFNINVTAKGEGERLNEDLQQVHSSQSTSDTKISELKQDVNGDFVFNFSQATAASFVVPCHIRQGYRYKINGLGDGVYNVYLANSESISADVRVQTLPYAPKNGSSVFTANASVEYINGYANANTAFSITAVQNDSVLERLENIESENAAISDSVTKAESYIDGIYSGDFIKEFSITPSEHSQYRDNLYTKNIKAGDTINVLVELTSGTCNNESLSCVLFYTDGTKKNTSFVFGTALNIKATKDVASIGFYIYKITAAGTVKATITSISEIEKVNKEILEVNSKIIDNSLTSIQRTGAGTWTIPFKFKIGRKYAAFGNANTVSTLRLLGSNDYGDNVQTLSNLNYQSIVTFVPAVNADYIGGYTNDTNTISVVCIDDISVINLNGGYAKIENIVKSLAKRGKDNEGSNQQVKQLTLLHFSDIHGVENALSRIITFYKNYINYINDVLCTGDIVLNLYSESLDFWNNAGAQKVLVTIGNHETSLTNNIWSEVPRTDVYTKFIKPYVSGWAVTQPTGAEENGYNYYYKDYSEQKIRLIVLDAYYIDEGQLEWLEDVLNDAKDTTSQLHSGVSLSVIVACHERPERNTARYSGVVCTFDSVNPRNGLSVSSNELNSLADKVDAFISSGGEFIVWLFGHYHEDEFFYLKDYPNILAVGVGAAKPNAGDRDFIRDEGTKGYDLFNLISFDTDNKIFRIARIGASQDRYLRNKEFICYDYANKKVIYNG